MGTTIKMNEEELAELIVKFCEAEHLTHKEKYEFVLDSIKKIQLAVKEK